ncbi:RNA polymerase sigma factor [Spirosoma montaniterrae]|uniref:RNA polymerase subunit sigma-24 n=1 Tax=Spirosoma montaniterrae TaxID=1178516 RepID=A0A1P9WWZ4_9BACT|nr:sigma-70 family RNA polymerase sigma factor [Spirosoma montaniterrae]AQG79891.1 hypothetical protein AWR27_11485 [Spirosoma montaniterrae]
MANHLSFSDDTSLWNAFRAGDCSAFEQLYYQHSRALLAYGKRLCADHALVQDAVQDVFVEVWKRRATLRDLGTVRFYLFRVLRNQLSEQLTTRTNPLLHPHALAEHAEDIGIPAIDLLITEQETSDRVQLRLRQCIEQLPQRQREALTLAFYHQFSHQEIAQIMAINGQSVTNHINRALHTLRELLTGVLWAMLMLHLLPIR